MSEQYLVFVGDGPWRLASVDGATPAAPVPFGQDASVEERVAAVRQLLMTANATEEPLVLALPSAWCLSAVISTEDIDRTARRRALAYRLEEHLPVAAEDVVADHVGLDDSRALCVCAELSRLRPLLAAFEAAGLKVGHIFPAALLAAAYAADQHPRLDGVLLGGGTGAGGGSEAGYDFIELRNGKPERWWWLAHDEAALRERLAAWPAARSAGRRLALIGCPPALPGRLGVPPHIATVDLNIDHDAAATGQVAAMMKTDRAAWIDLRSGPLAGPEQSQAYRAPMVRLVAAVAVLLGCLTGAAIWRGHQYDVLRQSSVQQQAAVFREAMPGQPVPGSIKGRLASERRKLGGPSGQPSDEAQAAAMQPLSALAQLRDVLKSLPANLRYRILDLSIQPDLVRVEGEAQSHAEAESLAASLRQSGIYDVDPPKTQALKEQGVSFIFSATPRASAGLPKVDKP
jgi:hypothetical protein